jgi:hypothetical protein
MARGGRCASDLGTFTRRRQLPRLWTKFVGGLGFQTGRPGAITSDIHRQRLQRGTLQSSFSNHWREVAMLSDIRALMQSAYMPMVLLA